MKKLCLIALVLVLTLSLTACFRRKNDEPTTPSTTIPATSPSMPLPTMDPTTEPSGSWHENDGTIPGAANEDMYDNTEPTNGRHRRMPPKMGGFSA